VEDVRVVAGTIRNSAFGVLAGQDELFQLFLVDPVLLLNHAKGRVDPPGVANITQLLRSAIKATFRGLPLAQPLGQLLLIERVPGPNYFQCPNATEHIRCMRLSVRDSPEGSIKVLALEDKLRSFFDINFAQCSQQVQAGHPAVGVSGVDLPPFVTHETAVLFLQAAHILHDLVYFHFLEPIKTDKDQHCVVGAQYM
jgi:hypothetical protein